MEKIKLKYSSRMKHQDELWQNQLENKDIMKTLHKEICNEATAKGWTGYFESYIAGYESEEELITNIYAAEEYRNKDDIEEFFCAGTCEALIREFERILNIQNEQKGIL